MPTNRIAGEQVAEELRNNTQAVRLIAMDCVVVLHERLLEQVPPKPVQLREPLTNKTVELVVCALLRCALNNHRRELTLIASRKVNFHQLVTTFFEATAGLDREIYGTA